MLPNLSKLCHPCEPCGVTKQDFSILLPGLNLAPGQPEIVLDEEDYECKICYVSMHYPATGFKPEDGEAIFQLQTEFDANPNPTKEQKDAYHAAARKAADELRKKNPSRTQIELLHPGCGHQFHRECLAKHVTARATQESTREKCIRCFTPIDKDILSSLRGSMPQGLTRQRSFPPPADQLTVPAPAERPFLMYCNSVYRKHTQARAMLTSVRPDIANGPVLRPVSLALNGLIETLREYRIGDIFPTYNSEMHRKWDEKIGDIIVVYRATKVYLVELIDGIDRDDYQSIAELLKTIEKLIHALVPPPDEPEVRIIREGVNSSWTYMDSNEDTVLKGQPPLYILFMQRTPELGTFENDARVQPIRDFVNRIRESEQPNNFMGDEANFILLGTMLLSAVGRALNTQNLDEFERFRGIAPEYVTKLFPTFYLSPGPNGLPANLMEFVRLLTEFRL